MLLNLTKWFTKTPAAPVIVVAGQKRIAAPLDLERTLHLALLIAPYIPLIEEYKATFTEFMGEPDRPRLLSALFRSLAREMQQAPGDIVKMFAILIDEPVEYVARHVTAAEILAALPVLDEINDFGALVAATKALGLTVRFERD